MLKLLLVAIVFVKLFLSYELLVGRLALYTYALLITPVFSISFYYLLKQFIRNKTWRLCLVVLDLCLPFYGILSVFLITVLNLFFKRSDDEVTEENFYLKDFESNILQIQNNLLSQKTTKPDADISKLEPYLDIFNGNNPELKIDACIKLSYAKDKSSIELLKIALQDDQYDVRYMANNALDKIEKKFMLELEQVSGLISKHPLVTDNYLLRSEIYSQLASSGILDETVTDYFLNKALADLNYVLMYHPENHFVFLKLAYIFTQQEKYEELLDLSHKALQLNVEDNEKNKILFFAAEAAFALRDFDQLQSFISQLNLKKVKYNKILVSSLFWKGLGNV